MTDEERLALVMAAASSAAGAAVNLIEMARANANDPRDIDLGETVEYLADATKMALEASEQLDEERGQLLGALVRFLEGWAG